MAYLVIQTSQGVRHLVELKTRSAVVGRAVGCELRVDDSSLSREHCRLEAEGETWMLVDLASINGTFVDRLRVYEHVLQNGQVIDVGKTQITFFNDRPVLDRPADPLGASPFNDIVNEEAALADTALLGVKFLLPHPNPKSPAQLSALTARSQPQTPLPFTRPRPYPRPIAVRRR